MHWEVFEFGNKIFLRLKTKTVLPQNVHENCAIIRTVKSRVKDNPFSKNYTITIFILPIEYDYNLKYYYIYTSPGK